MISLRPISTKLSIDWREHSLYSLEMLNTGSLNSSLHTQRIDPRHQTIIFCSFKNWHLYIIQDVQLFTIFVANTYYLMFLISILFAARVRKPHRRILPLKKCSMGSLGRHCALENRPWLGFAESSARVQKWGVTCHYRGKRDLCHWVGWSRRTKRNDVMGVMVFGGKNVVHNNGGREMAWSVLRSPLFLPV